MRLINENSAGAADASSRNSQPLEWWFVQGEFRDPVGGSREFMVSLFRHGLKWGPFSGGDACTLLVSVFDPATGRAAVLSQVDGATVSFVAKALRKSPPAGLDPVVAEAVARELADSGAPLSLRTAESTWRIESSPFRVKWGEFEFWQEGGRFGLCFDEPETGRRCRFMLDPAHAPCHLAEVKVQDGGEMDYASFTRLALQGDVDGAPAQGVAWFDHQWGSQGWFVGGKNAGELFGWDWMGIQLDGARELLLMCHHAGARTRILSQYGVLVDRNGAASLIRDFGFSPTSWWTSPKTRGRYPLCWDVHIPEHEIELRFAPLAEDQEIPLLPPVRGVWEGAGRVEGTWAGSPVAGRARLELHGYAYIMDVRQQLQSVTAEIRGHLRSFLPPTLRVADIERLAGPARGLYDAEAQTEMICKPLWDLMDRDGHQWWAAFGSLMTAALGADPRPYELLTSVTAEMLHDGALVIDDIQDHGRLRRGQECIHLKYGLDVAIMAGNTAYFLPMVLLADYPGLSDGQRLELYRVLTRLYIRAHLGQAQDLYWSATLGPARLSEWLGDSIEPKLLQVYDQKTASLTEAAAEGAAIIAEADAATRARCADFGRALGVALQIINDITNFHPARVGAGCGGSDLAEGKLTFVILRALQRLRGTGRFRLAEIFATPELRGNASVLLEGIELVRKSGALEASQKHAADLLEKEWQNLSGALRPSESKIMLRVLWSYVAKMGQDRLLLDYAPG